MLIQDVAPLLVAPEAAVDVPPDVLLLRRDPPLKEKLWIEQAIAKLRQALQAHQVAKVAGAAALEALEEASVVLVVDSETAHSAAQT